MSEEVNGVDTPTAGAEVPAVSADLIPRTEAQKAFTARDEAKTRANAAEAKLAEYDAEAEVRRVADLSAFDKLKEENDKLRLSSARADTLSETIKNQVDSMIAEIPEDKRSLIPEGMSPDQKLAYINTNKVHLMAVAIPPKTFNGAPAPGKPILTDLTDDEKALCKQAGMSEEDYAKYK